VAGQQSMDHFDLVSIGTW